MLGRFYNPPNSRIADVRDFGAVSGQDCSAAFQNAYLWALNNSNRFGFPKPVYVPDGDWWVTHPVISRIGSIDRWTNPTLTALGKVSLHDGWRAGMIFIGQSTNGTIIRVPPNSAGFQNAASPIGVFATGSERGAGGQRDNNPDGGGNIAFRHGVYNMTIIIESGNPGAIGLDMVVTNRGGASNVRIIDAGGSARFGVSFHRYGAGPCYYKNIVVEGFEYALWMGGLQPNEQRSDYLIVAENWSIRNQRVGGIYNNGLACTIRNITSCNSVPFYRNISRRTAFTCTNATLYPNETVSKGALTGLLTPALSPERAFDNAAGVMHLRSIRNEAYQTTIDDRFVSPARISTERIIREYFTTSIPSLFSGINTARRLDLTVLPTPEFFSSNPSDYANIEDYGAAAGSGFDSSDGIQSAIDSGKPAVYAPNNVYFISRPIILRGPNLRYFLGCTARIDKIAPFTGPAFIVGGQAGEPPIILEQLRFDNIVHDSPRDLVMVHLNSERYTTTANAAGARLFVEDIMGIVLADHPIDIWARQLDSEFDPVNLRVTGGSCWVLGYKTESDLRSHYSTNIQARRGARVQIDGSHMYPLGAIPRTVPCMDIDESELQINFRMGGVGGYGVLAKHTQYGQVRILRGGGNTAMFNSRF